jgi:hypothetical protein
MFYTSNWRSGIVYFWGVPWSPKEKERPTVSMPMTLGFRHLWLKRKGRVFGNVAHPSSVVSRRIKEEAQLVEKTHGRSGNRESDHLPQSFVHIKQEGLRWDRLWINEEINLLGGIHYNESTQIATQGHKRCKQNYTVKFACIHKRVMSFVAREQHRDYLEPTVLICTASWCHWVPYCLEGRDASADRSSIITSKIWCK